MCWGGRLWGLVVGLVELGGWVFVLVVGGGEIMVEVGIWGIIVGEVRERVGVLELDRGCGLIWRVVIVKDRVDRLIGV